MYNFNILSDKELEKVHEQALNVLEKVGCIIEHQEALEILESSGAIVDFTKKRARFHEDIVSKAMQLAPKKYLAAGLNPAYTYEVYAGMPTKLRGVGGALKWLSITQKEKRLINLADAKRMLALADGLPEINLVGTPFAAEFPTKTYDIHSLRLAMTCTSKHIWSLTIGSKNLAYQMEMLRAAGGGKENSQKRISGIVCVIDPLKFPHDEIERLKIYGDNMVPIKCTSSSMIGGNAPYTVAGGLIQNVAQFLAFLVITQTIRPGIPIVYYITIQDMDMRIGSALFSSPELMMARAAIAQIARHYNLPSSITTVSGTGTEPQQALFLRTYDLMTCMLSGAGEVNLGGSLDGGAFFCPEILAIDNESMAYLRHFLNGFEMVDGITDVIARGIDSGQYLTDPHTLKYLRKQKRYFSDLLDGRSHDVWANNNPRNLIERAWEKALHIIETHEAPPLKEELVKELDRIVAVADKELL